MNIIQEDSMDETIDGTGYMSIGFVLYIIFNIIMMGAYLSVADNPGSDIGPVNCFASLFILPALLLFILGIYKIYIDKDDFSEAHQQKVKIAIVLLFFALVTQSLANSIRTAYVTEFQGDISYYRSHTEAAINYIRWTFVKSGIISFLSTLFYSLFTVFLVIELAGERAKKYLYSGAGINVLISLAFIVTIYFTFSGSDDVLGSLVSMIRYSSFILGLSSIGFVFILMGYRKTNSDLSRSPPKKSTDLKETYDLDSPLKDNKTCPECGEKSLYIAKDRSAVCYSCDFSTQDYYTYKEKNE